MIFQEDELPSASVRTDTNVNNLTRSGLMSTNFKVGENIVHIHHGVGKIEKIDNITIDGKKPK